LLLAHALDRRRRNLRHGPKERTTMASGVDARLLKSTKFPPEFNQKVDTNKVNIQVIKKYARKILPPQDQSAASLAPRSFANRMRFSGGLRIVFRRFWEMKMTS
jgi:hypothetical protein